ncbi:UNVERIFIED_CONTAM: hypothetical protein K2H54_013122 [Gekko kuhli]
MEGATNNTYQRGTVICLCWRDRAKVKKGVNILSAKASDPRQWEVSQESIDELASIPDLPSLESDASIAGWSIGLSMTSLYSEAC